MFAPKLQSGNHIRVISPAISLSIISAEIRAIADERLRTMGLQVSFSKHADEEVRFESSSIASRVADLHAAFADTSVNGILTTLGGYNSHQLLDYLNYDEIAQNPKVLCGFSDITALGNAIYAKTGLVTYSGPHYSTLGMKQSNEYTIEYFQKCVFQDAPFAVEPATTWSDDAWYMDQDNRVFIPNDGYVVLQEGEAEGTLVGGNASTFILLHGTPYMPALNDTILMIEDDEEASPVQFDRYLQSIIHQPGFKGVRGLVIGRFQVKSHLELEALSYIISTKRELRGMPIIANASFGHTTPQFTFPIGGRGAISARTGAVQFQITQH
jgi:muramoyltetrapeptide carboxypeptidase